MKKINKLLLKNKLFKIGFGISLGVVAIGAIVGGYANSYNANPYRKYYRTTVNDSIQSVIASFRSAVENGAELLVLPGFTAYNPMIAALKEPVFNRTGFLLIDEKLKNDGSENSVDKATSQVASLQFRTDEGSFITGIALGQFLNDHKEYFKKDDGKLTWGIYGGMNFSSVTSYMGGFQQGIEFFNDEIVKKNSNLERVEQVFLGDSSADNFAGSFASDGGNALIDLFLQKNIDCLIPVAGPQAPIAAAKISSKKDKRTVVLGVDIALEDNSIIKEYALPNGPDKPKSIVPFSSLKNISEITPKVMTAINQGLQYQVNSEGVGGFGVNTLANILNNGVGVSESGRSYFVKAISTYKNNQSIKYDEALREIQNEPRFKKLSTDSGLVFKAGSSEFKYTDLPIESTIYSKNSKNVPSGFNMTQKEWESKATFNLKNFIKDKIQSDDNKIKIIVTPSTSVLLDNSFNQSSYLALFLFFKSYNINIPSIKNN